MQEELERFVASLAIPAARKTVVLAELRDHAASAAEAAARAGRDPEAAARDALGNLEALRRSLEAVEPAFHVSRAAALARGAVASLLVALAIDRGGPMYGLVGALVAVGIAMLLAPPYFLELLRAELRAPRVPGTLLRGVPIGAAATYAYAVMSGPFLVWIALIVVRAEMGHLTVLVPWSSFGLMATVLALLLVESVRARFAAA